MKYVLWILAMTVPCGAVAAAAPAPATGVPAYVTALLTAYASKDVPGVMELLDPQATMYGDAASEFFNTPLGIRGLLASDYRQWTSARFGAPSNVSLASSDGLQTVFFDVPLTLDTAGAHTMTVTVRFATVWHKVGDRYLLLQSSNSTVR